MGKTPKEIIEKRQEQVENLYFVLNRTQKEIAKALGWGEDTIWNDIQAIRTKWKERAERLGDEPVLKYIERKEMMIKKAMEGLAKSQTEKNQQNWIRTIVELDKDLLEKLMDIGMIRRAPVEQINYNMDSVIKIAQEVKLRNETK